MAHLLGEPSDVHTGTQSDEVAHCALLLGEPSGVHTGTRSADPALRASVRSEKARVSAMMKTATKMPEDDLTAVLNSIRWLMDRCGAGDPFL